MWDLRSFSLFFFLHVSTIKLGLNPHCHCHHQTWFKPHCQQAELLDSSTGFKVLCSCNKVFIFATEGTCFWAGMQILYAFDHGPHKLEMETHSTCVT